MANDLLIIFVFIGAVVSMLVFGYHAATKVIPDQLVLPLKISFTVAAVVAVWSGVLLLNVWLD